MAESRRSLHNRIHPRVEIHVEVTMESDHNFYTGLSSNVSEGGLFVATHAAPPLGTRLLVRFMLDGGGQVQAVAPGWKVPTLLLWAGSDRCVAPAGSAAFAAAAPANIVRAQAFAPLFHEIFNEPEQASVFAALGAWLAERGQ